MQELLSFEADRRAVEITINSLGTDLSRDDRRRLFPEMGNLHPFWHHALASCDDYDQVRSVVEENPERTSMASPLAKLAENAVEKVSFGYGSFYFFSVNSVTAVAEWRGDENMQIGPPTERTVRWLFRLREDERTRVEEYHVDCWMHSSAAKR